MRGLFPRSLLKVEENSQENILSGEGDDAFLASLALLLQKDGKTIFHVPKQMLLLIVNNTLLLCILSESLNLRAPTALIRFLTHAVLNSKLKDPRNLRHMVIYHNILIQGHLILPDQGKSSLTLSVLLDLDPGTMTHFASGTPGTRKILSLVTTMTRFPPPPSLLQECLLLTLPPSTDISGLNTWPLFPPGCHKQ